ncbi:MAG: hypothetical protein AB9856_02075 [Cellulosilyticaceae bacterium]
MKSYYVAYKIPNDQTIAIRNDNIFGIIQNDDLKEIIEELLDEKGNVSLEEATEGAAKTYLNVCKVVNTLCYKVSSSPEVMEEFNPTLKLECSEDSFWSVNETEYKIDVNPSKDFSFNHFKQLFEEVTVQHFDMGKIQRTNSFERYLELEARGKKDYLVLLGKKGWAKKPAIKLKKQAQGDILTRTVKILELTKENLINSIEELTQNEYQDVAIRRFPSFYKTKDRVVCIDHKRGYIYGLSYSEAKTLSKDNQCFNQIEIEFWSQLISSNEAKDINWENVRLSHQEIILAIEEQLTNESFDYNAPGGRKYDWLSQTTKSTRRLSLEDIV